MGLLEYLADIVGCQYLSDLPSARITEKQAKKIEGIADDRFPLQQFEEAFYYLFQEKSNFCSVGEAKQAIVERFCRL